MRMRVPSGVLLALVLSLSFFSCGDRKEAEAKALLERARALDAATGKERKDALQKMRILLKKALDLSPELGEAQGLLARVLLEQGEFKKALDLVEGIPYPADRDSLTMALAAAELYRLKGDPSLADKALLGLADAGEAVRPEDRFRVARALLEGPGEEGHRKGIDLLEKLLASMENPPSAWLAMAGVALFRAGRRKEALPYLEKALKDPALPEAETIRKLAGACK